MKGRISWPEERLSACEVRLCSMQSITSLYQGCPTRSIRNAIWFYMGRKYPCRHLADSRHLHGRRCGNPRFHSVALAWFPWQYYNYIVGPSTKRTKDLLRLNRDQLRWAIGLLTGHCHLKGHLFKLGLTADPICEGCLEDDESSIHILCDCEAVTQDSVSWVNSLWNQVTTMTPP
jgi:hypothetical protein